MSESSWVAKDMDMGLPSSTRLKFEVMFMNVLSKIMDHMDKQKMKRRKRRRERRREKIDKEGKSSVEVRMHNSN
jgi:hypothetical protein